MSTQFDNFFLFSSMYSDRLLTEFLPRLKDRAYERYMEIQRVLLNGVEFHGILGTDFTESKELDETFAYPQGSVYCQLDGYHLPVTNQIRFSRKYGNGNVDIPADDFVANGAIFAGRFNFTIGSYRFDHFHMLEDRFHRVWIAIRNDANDGLSEALFSQLAGEPWFLWSDRHSAVYRAEINLGTAVSTLTDENYVKVTMAKTNLTNIADPTDENLWDVCMTASYQNTGYYLYHSTEAYLLEVTNSTISFQIPVEFYNSIHSANTSVVMTAIHKPYRRNIHVNCGSEGTDPIVYMDEDGNPPPAENVVLYAFSNERKTRGRRYSMADVKPEYFPGIYNLSSITDGDILIEVVDYPDSMTKTSFDNHFSELINALGSSGYRDSIVGGEISSYEAIVGFDPIAIHMDFADFHNSEYSDNLREYKLHKLLDLMNSDPWIYVEYLEYMGQLNNEGWTEAGTPRHFKINTGLGSCLSYQAQTPVMDSSIVSNRTGSKPVVFDEPHGYIKIRCSNTNVYVRVYLNGRLIYPTLVAGVDNEVYAFIPQSIMKDYLSEYTYLQDQVDSGTRTFIDSQRVLANAQPIIVEVFPQMDHTKSTRRYARFIAGDLSNYYQLFSGLVYQRITTDPFDSLEEASRVANDLNGHRNAYYTDIHGNPVHIVGEDATVGEDLSVTYTVSTRGGIGDRKICINDLVFYNITTGKYIDPDSFDYQITLHRAELEFSDGVKFQVLGMEDDVQYLYTHAGELYETQDLQSIILDEHTEDLVPTFNPDANPDSGEPRSWDDLKNRPIAIKDLKIRVDDGQLLGSEIGVCINRTAQEWDIGINSSDVDLDENRWSITLRDFFGNPRAECFELYINGVQIPQSDETVSGFSIILPEKTTDSPVLVLNERLSNFISESPSSHEDEPDNVVFKVQYLPRPMDAHLDNLASHDTTHPTTIRPTRSVFFADQFHSKRFCNPRTFSCFNLFWGKISNQWYDQYGQLRSFMDLAGDSHSLYLHPLSNYKGDDERNFNRDCYRVDTLGFNFEDFEYNASEWKNYLSMTLDKSAIAYITTEPTRDVALEGLVKDWPLNEYLEK